MLKLLKVKVSGFMLLDDGFTIDFLNKSKVTEEDKEREVVELREGLYVPTTTVFTGRNSSGKSTVFQLLKTIHSILLYGRLKYNKLLFKNKTIDLEFHFLMHNHIYRYGTTIHKPNLSVMEDDLYCTFDHEILEKRRYAKSYGKHNLEKPFESVEIEENKVNDTSILFNLTAQKHHYLMFANDILDSNKVITNMFKLIEVAGLKDSLVSKITGLFDDAIRTIDYDEETNVVHIVMQDKRAYKLSPKQASQFLSEGTKKGLILFGYAVVALNLGNTLVIDEIENSFHKNLVENIIMIFNDKRINKHGATLMFSTHYVEILDIFDRRDNIFLMKKDGTISAKNLYKDYNKRSELLKSNQFNSNAFSTLINYDQLMSLKKELRHEISDHA